MSIDVSSVCLDYDGSVVLKDISLEVKSGEILALVGPNGAGKSSLLNIMSGNNKPNAGTVKYNGVPLDKITISERATLRSVMGQNAPIVYDYTVSDVIEMGWIQSNLIRSSESKFYDEMRDVTTECKLARFYGGSLTLYQVESKGEFILQGVYFSFVTSTTPIAKNICF